MGNKRKNNNIGLCYSVAKYATPVWSRSKNAHLLDPELNHACRAFTRCMKSTNAWTRVGTGGVMLYICGVWVWILCIDGRSRYQCIVLGGYLQIWGAPSVQSCCTLWISAFWHVFVYGRYHKSTLACLKLLDLDWSRHHLLLWAAASAIQRVRMAGLPQKR